MKTLEVYTIYKNSDQTEGRGHSIPVVRFDNKFEAERLACDSEFYGRHGVMGCNNLSIGIETFDVYESYEEYQTIHGEAELKRIALSKLTQEDRRVLGLLD